MRLLLLAALAIPLVCLSGSSTEPPAGNDPWADYRFLIGEWVGEGEGQPGQGKGEFSLKPDLQGKILVRKNRSEYPAAGQRPAVTHEDLMILYRSDNKKETKAIYFDSEGHVIQYTPSFSADGATLTMLSDAAPSLPRYRLTYTKADNGVVKVGFAVAPPGKPDAFKTYVEGRVRRK
jgi:hypothetical protein